MLELDVSYYWFALGAVLFLVEAVGVNGIGLLFGGIAATIIGLLIEINIVAQQSITIQWTIWFLITALMAIILYKPMKKWRTNPTSKDRFSNIIGDNAKVGVGGLMLGKPGKIYWSGTLMNAAIDESSKQEAFMEGDIVKIADIRGNQLLVVASNEVIYNLENDD